MNLPTLQAADLSRSDAEKVSAVKNENNAMQKEHFLKLLVAQLQHQDPMSPMENKDLMAQLAQFSGLEQNIETNKKLDKLVDISQSQQNFSATDMIGKTVRAKGDVLHVSDNSSSIPLAFHLSEDATQVDISLHNSYGATVSTIALSNVRKGMHEITWNGLDASGQHTAKGDYRIEINAKDGKGQSVHVDNFVESKVTGISFLHGQTKIQTGHRTFDMADVLEIKN